MLLSIQDISAASIGQEAWNPGSVVSDLPTRLTIESTAICNLRCVMCPQGIGAVDRPKHLPLELFAKLRTPLAKARHVQLHGIGEPLASPSFWDALASGYFQSDTDIVINTNMTLLNERRLELLIAADARLTLNISLDAATARTYRRIRGHDFAEVIENIRRLRQARGERRYPILLLNMTLMRENIEEVVAFVELGKQLDVDWVYFWHLNRVADEEMALYRSERDGWVFDYAAQGLWNHQALSNRMLRAAVERGVQLGMPVGFDESKTTFFDEPAQGDQQPTIEIDEEPAADPATVKDCRHPWDSLLVTSDGTARTCCYSKPIGDLNTTDFMTLWNGGTFQELRSALSEDRLHPICEGAACKYVQNMPKPVPAPLSAEGAAHHWTLLGWAASLLKFWRPATR